MKDTAVEYKGYNIVPDGTFGYYSVKSVGRGSIPRELVGFYTNTEFAKKAIDTFGKRDKGETSGETESDDRG